MTGFEETIKSVLVRTVPLPAGVGRDWEDVLARSATSTKTARTRRLVYSVAFAAVLAIVLATTPLGAMIARGFGDFSGWLSGSTGHPASTGEQQTFAHEYKNSWIRFPKTPALRSLIRVRRDGVAYELFGFRAGDAFCLRLVASSTSRSTYTSCAPKSDLVARRTPVLPLTVDAPIVDRVKTGRRVFFVRRAGVTFGITSDGVAAVRASAQSSDLKGAVGGDSFLIINPRAASGAHVSSIKASDTNGDEVVVPFTRSFFDTPVAGTSPTLPGPTKAERPVEHVRVGWIARREPRGTAVPPGIFRFRKSTFRRLLAPDPGGVARVLVYVDRNDELCFGLVLVHEASAGCAPLGSSPNWPYPFTLGEVSGGSGQYASVFGLADDVVARMTLFLADGESVAVPLKDNAFVIEAARSKYPFRLVAYDSAGIIVGVKTIQDPSIFRATARKSPPR